MFLYKKSGKILNEQICLQFACNWQREQGLGGEKQVV